MDHPEWTAALVSADGRPDDGLQDLVGRRNKKRIRFALARGTSGGTVSDSRNMTQSYLEKAQECMAEKNFAGCILWLHRAIESEPDSSSHRAMLGRCLSAIPEYRREAVEQFEMAIELDPAQSHCAFPLRGIARTAESALAGAVPLPACSGAGRESFGSARTFEPAGCGRPRASHRELPCWAG